MLPGTPAARPCSAAILVASPRRARGAQRPRPGCRPAPRPGRGRNAHNRHSGWPPRSAGNSLPQPRSARCRTVPGRGPQARSGSPAPLPPRVPGAARRPPRCPGRAIRGPAGTTCTRHQAGPVVHPTIAALSPGGNPGRPVVLLTYVQILPSGHGPATPGSAGLALEPFRGVRYAQDRVTGLAEVTSPPYDVIAHDTADKLLAADPHNVVRLILPPQDPGRAGASGGSANGGPPHPAARGSGPPGPPGRTIRRGGPAAAGMAASGRPGIGRTAGLVRLRTACRRGAPGSR